MLGSDTAHSQFQIRDEEILERFYFPFLKLLAWELKLVIAKITAGFDFEKSKLYDNNEACRILYVLFVQIL